MDYTNEYTEQDAQRDQDARERAEEPYIQDFIWTDAQRAASERYLMIGGAFADDAGPIGMNGEYTIGFAANYGIDRITAQSLLASGDYGFADEEVA